MLFIKDHFTIDHILLLAVGLWPYKQSTFTRLQTSLFLGILTSFIACQFTTFMSAEVSLNLIFKTLSIAFCFIILLFEYVSFWINNQNMKCLMEQLQHICNELRDDNEVAIIEKYGYYARRFAIKMILFIMGGELVIIVHPFLTYIGDARLFRNESRLRPKIMITTNYFVDEDKYFYLTMLHMAVAVLIGMTAAIAIATFHIKLFKYVCGIFKVASYRIKKAFSMSMLANITSKNEIIIYNTIIHAVDIHRKAIQFAIHLISSFETTVFFIMMFGVCALSLNLFQVFYFVLRGGKIEEFLLHMVLTSVILFFMFLSNYVAEEVMNHNDCVFITVYNVRWYFASLHVKKLILFLLQKGNKPFTIVIGKLFVGSLEGFATLIKVSISYFTVMYSIQQ